MFYHFLVPLHKYFNVFRYITFRSIFALLTAFIVGIIIGRMVIRYFERKDVGEVIREDGPTTHKQKEGTPTMGGIIILLSGLFSILLWGNFYSHYLWIALLGTLLFGLLGFVDDYIKVYKKEKKAISPKVKLFFQFIISLLVVVLIAFFPADENQVYKLYIPFIKKPIVDFRYIKVFGYTLNLVFIYMFFLMIVIIATSNSVNLTDGLDGLAIGIVLINLLTFSIFTYLHGHKKIAEYLLIPYIPLSGELTVFLSAMVGASISFLWYNSHPAEIFMGDTGSMALGGLLGIVAIMIKQEFLLPILGGIFVVEALSVILQVGYYKRTKKRIFRMAPIHHHFELLGIHENKVVIRFWIISGILALIALSSLKIR